MKLIYESIEGWQPPFLRGYAGSLALFAKYCADNQLPLEFDTTFSTAEMLSDPQRKLIELTFATRVFDHYGLNDGGVSAYEGVGYTGYAVDTERSVLEIVPDGQKRNAVAP